MSKPTKSVNNPFAIQPNPDLVGIDEEKNKLVTYIQKGSICFLHGHPGCGKSSLLEWVKRNLNSHKVIYLNAKTADEYFNLHSYIKSNRSFFQRLFGRQPKNMVFLLDEAQAADQKVIDGLEALWNQGTLKSIVLTQIKPHLTNCPDSFIDRLGKRTVHLSKLNLVRVHDLIKLRTNGKHPFSDDAIEVIAERANYIPRKVLENCDVVSVELGDKTRIEKTDAKFVLDRKEMEELEVGAVELDETEPDETALIPLDSIDKLQNISPMEVRILKLFLESPKTSVQVSTILNTSIGSVGKQVNKLVKANIVEVINNRRPKVYGLTREFKISLKNQ